MNSEPLLPSLSARIVPRKRLTSPSETDRPRPEPCPTGLVVKNGSKTL